MNPTVIPDPPSPSRRRWSWQRFGGKFLALSIVAHLLLLAVAAYYVVESFSGKHKQTFNPSSKGPNASTRALEHKMQMKQQRSGSPPPSARRVVTTGLSKVSLPSMPMMPSMTSTLTPTPISGMGASGFGVGGGLGAGGGGGGTGLGGGPGITMFGATSGAGLSGTFFDLKQTRDGRPTPTMNATLDANEKVWSNPPNNAYDAVLQNVIRGGFGESFLSQYFRGPNVLYTKQVFIPSMSADNGPKAFDLEDKVQPKRWIVIYRGKVSPPEKGSYRLVGWADDVLVVRFAGQVALQGSLVGELGPRSKTTYKYGDTELFVSNPINVAADATYPIEIMIGERPGGLFCAYLLLEKVGEKYEKAGGGAPVLPIFKFGSGPGAPEGGGAPPTAPDTSWSVWKALAPAATSGLLH